MEYRKKSNTKTPHPPQCSQTLQHRALRQIFASQRNSWREAFNTSQDFLISILNADHITSLESCAQQLEQMSNTLKDKCVSATSRLFTSRQGLLFSILSVFYVYYIYLPSVSKTRTSPTFHLFTNSSSVERLFWSPNINNLSSTSSCSLASHLLKFLSWMLQFMYFPQYLFFEFYIGLKPLYHR